MAKWVAPDRGVKETVIGGKSYYADGRSGLYEVSNPSHQRAMKAEGFFPASLMGSAKHGVGYTCTACGFGSWFKKCSRCGHDNEGTPRDGEE